ncbi:MAG: tetratricopeptide repeat protein [Actinomycetota bacterium]
MASANVIEVGEEDFDDRVVEGSREAPVVVDFWAGWCRPCLVLGPVLERLAEEWAGRFVLAKVDVDANPRLAERFGVQGIPAVKGFRDGEVAAEFVGAQPEELVRRFLDDIVPSEADERVAVAREASTDEAEAELRAVLAEDPSHAAAAAGLAQLLLRRGDVDAARDVLSAASPSPEVRRLQARVDVEAMGRELGELGAAARAAAAGDHRQALERSLALIGEDGHRQAARELMVQVFELLGDDHPLTREYRSRLASALF